MSEEQPVDSNTGNQQGDAQQRRRRRGGRGGRGRGRRRQSDAGTLPSAGATTGEGPTEPAGDAQIPGTTQSLLEESSAVDNVESGARGMDDRATEQPVVPMAEFETFTPENRSRESVSRPQSDRLPTRAPSEAQVSSAIAEAIEDVYRITEVLKKVLEDLDELLETLELAERQKIEDERELDNLRRALRQLQQRPAQQNQRPMPPPPSRHPGRHQERHAQSSRPSTPPSKAEFKEQPPEDGGESPQT